MFEKKEYKLGSLADITSSKRIFYSDYVPKGIPFFRSKEIIERSLGEAGGEPLYILPEKYYEIKEKFGAPVDGDILLSAVGERAGIPYVVKNQGDFYFKDGNLIWLRNIQPELNANYFCYWIKSSIGQQTLENIMIGSAQKALTIIGLKHLSISLPCPTYQEMVAETLISIDDKIDLLNRQNKTLEELAEILFRHSFKFEGNQTTSLGRFVDCINGYSYKSSELKPSKNALVTLKNFERTGGFRLDGFKEFTGRVKEQQIVKEGDLIVAHTDITQDAEVIGNPALVIADPNYDVMVITMDLVKVLPKFEWLSIEFLYFLMKSREFKFHCLGCSNGTTVLHLSKKAIPSFEFQEPKMAAVKEFTSQAKPLLQKVFSNHRQIKTLTQLRDTLLPKLMSGEVRIESVQEELSLV